MKKLIIIALSIFVFLLVGCNTNKQIEIPQNNDIQVYVLEHHETGMPMETFVIGEEDDLFKGWQEKNKIRLGQQEYMIKTAQWEEQKKKQKEGEYWNEEERIEAYCKEHGYLHCIGITETCLKDGCHSVKITCEDDNFKPEKLDFDEFNPKYECKEYEITVE